MSRRVSFANKPPLLRSISNPYNKEDNKHSSQSAEEYIRNRQMAKTGLLRNSGKGPEFDPKKLAEEIRGYCAKGDEGFCHKAMSYVSSIFKDDSDHYDKLNLSQLENVLSKHYASVKKNTHLCPHCKNKEYLSLKSLARHKSQCVKKYSNNQSNNQLSSTNSTVSND